MRINTIIPYIGVAIVSMLVTNVYNTEKQPEKDIVYAVQTHAKLIIPIQNREETHCLAHNIYFEGRGESVQGQLGIGLVTLNRVRDRDYPNTVCKVVWQHRQFSWTLDGKSDTPKDTNAYTTAYLIASSILDKDNAIRDFTSGSLMYHADYVEPYWKDHYKQTTKIGSHIFYARNN